MKINFSKYNGAGNDFILIDDRENIINDNKSLISYLCNRHFGIGGDGLIILKESSNSDFEILHYTSDGNLGSLCGNGSRCAVLFAFNKDIISNVLFINLFTPTYKFGLIHWSVHFHLHQNRSFLSI